MAITARAAKPLSEISAKYRAKTAAAGADWLTGVRNPKRLFNSAAVVIEGSKKWAAMLQAAIAAGTWATNMTKVDMAKVEAILDALGPGVYTQAVAAKAVKFDSAAAGLMPAIQANAAAVNGMPNATPADADARMLKMAALNRALKGKFKGR